MLLNIHLIGNLGSDPVMKTLDNGSSVTSFSVATNRVWTDANGEKQEKVTWIRANCWGKLAGVTSQYLSKGRQVYIESDQIESRAWIDEESGQARSSLEVRVKTIKFLGSKGEGASNAAPFDDDFNLTPESADPLF